MQMAIYGALAAGHLGIAVIFLRFWKKVNATILLVFSVSFALLALSYVLLCFVEQGGLPPVMAFLLRLTGFVVIAAGIIFSNLRKPGGN